MKKYAVSFLTIVLIIYSCKPNIDSSIVGKWQSLNDYSTVLEFTDDNKIILYRDGNSFWALASENGEMNYQITSDKGSCIEFRVFDGSDFWIKGEIEKVSSERLRVYFYKHHDILDVADEYYKTKDFESFDSIMHVILSQPEIDK